MTAGVDVQADRLEVAIWAWGKGEEAWLIRYEQILGDPLQNDVWEQLANITSQVYFRLDNGRTRVSRCTAHREMSAELRVRATCIDSGYLTQEVYHRVRKHRFLHWFAIKGVSGDGKPMISRPTGQEINYKGDRIKRGIQLYKVGVDLAKETLYARSQITAPGAKYLNFPNDLENDWYRGFCSEVQVTKHQNGRPYLVWEKLSGVRNEPLDISVYALAGAYLVGISRIDWKGEEEKLIVSSLDVEKKAETPNKQSNYARNVRRRRGKNLVDQY